ncbi:unnamed protein product [Protopolystoma xenopodis]|uniref:Uncharacterized protein n=1 Tax=Protopolystoma xenopodis TaxID=117903 RepID=A0A3S5AZY8_9PLAT|nr:unnamed protein product [Protopolystoma xenopodis]
MNHLTEVCICDRHCLPVGLPPGRTGLDDTSNLPPKESRETSGRCRPPLSQFRSEVGFCKKVGRVFISLLSLGQSGRGDKSVLRVYPAPDNPSGGADA